MIDFDKLSKAHIEALFIANGSIPDKVAELMPFANQRMQASFDKLVFERGEERDKQVLAAVKDVLAEKKLLFKFEGEKGWFSKPEGERVIMEAYDDYAKRIMSNNSEFTTAVKQDGFNAERLIEALKGINCKENTDLGCAITQSIELSYFKDKPFSEVLSKRMKELGMVTRKQAKQVAAIVTAYESGNYEHLLKPVAAKAAYEQEAPKYENIRSVESPKAGETFSDSAKVKEDVKGFAGRIAAMSKGQKWALGGAGIAAAVGGWVAHEHNKNNAANSNDLGR